MKLGLVFGYWKELNVMSFCLSGWERASIIAFLFFLSSGWVVGYSRRYGLHSLGVLTGE